MKLALDIVGALTKIALGEADHPPAGEREAPVAEPVVLESAVGVVEAAAIHLDDQAAIGPAKVDLVPAAVREGDPVVDLGLWQAAGTADPQHEALEATSNLVLAAIGDREDASERARPPPRWRASDDRLDLRTNEDPLRLRAVDHVFGRVLGEHAGEIADRPGNRGAGNTGDHGEVAGDDRCRGMNPRPSRRRPTRPAVVTSMSVADDGLISWSAPHDANDSTAPGPQARTAAAQ